jgi:arylsulfatase A-like enzyme
MRSTQSILAALLLLPLAAARAAGDRAGLLTGRYQNRFGFEANWPGSLSGKAGLPHTSGGCA